MHFSGQKWQIYGEKNAKVQILPSVLCREQTFCDNLKINISKNIFLLTERQVLAEKSRCLKRIVFCIKPKTDLEGGRNFGSFSGNIQQNDYFCKKNRMSTLGKGTGNFSLSDSDHCVGSYFSVDDIITILDIDISYQSKIIDYLIQNDIYENGVVDEGNFFKHYRKLKNTYSIEKCGKSNWDELVLLAIIKRCYPNAEYQAQYPIVIDRETKYVDLYVNNGQKKLLIEFDGPSHFAKTQFGYPEKDPLLRVQKAQDATGIEMIKWPFWIQRCERNVKIIFEGTQKKQGFGALWSTNVLFNSFIIDRPTETIKKLTQQFNAEDDDGIGYFYGTEDLTDSFGRKQYIHPLIAKSKKRKLNLQKFIPNDADMSDYHYWLPRQLWEIADDHFKNTI